MQKRGATWRYIPPIDAPGEVQMSLDEWLLEQHRQGLHPPTLRFYTWNPIAISLGYHQRRYPPFWDELTWKNQPIDLVKRPSGGRAVLHQGDLTYAVITSGMRGTRMQTYQEICQFLIQAWRSVGVTLQYGAAGRGYIHNPNCFGTATGADLVTPEGMKLIGSAQLCRSGAVLQHGSMQLSPNLDLFQQVFGVELEAVKGVSSIAGRLGEAAMQTVIEALLMAAGDCFAAELVTQPLSEVEWSSVLSRTSASRTTIHSPSTWAVAPPGNGSV